MKVAVILTGQLRYIDWCWNWWESVAKESEHNIDFFSSTWPYDTSHDNNLTFNRTSGSTRGQYRFFIDDWFSDRAIGFITSDPAELQKYYKRHSELDEYLTPPKDSLGYSKVGAFRKFQYYFGRLHHLSKAINEFDLSRYDKIVHSRWDTLVRPGHFDSFLGKGWIFSGLQNDPDDFGNTSKLLHSNDLIYSGDATDFINIYKDTYSLMDFICDRTVKLKNLEWITGSKYIIGHYLYVNHLNDKCRVLHNVDIDTTLYRNYSLPFKYDFPTWKDCLYVYGVDVGHVRNRRVKKNKVLR